MTPNNKFAEVILPVPVHKAFTYSIPEKFLHLVDEGIRVIVPFGARKYYSGIIRNIHNYPPSGYKVKEIDSVVDEFPIVNKYQLKFWEWMADYYMCSTGEVYKAAVPSGLKLESKTRYYIVSGASNINLLVKQELKLLDALKNKNGQTIKELQKSSGQKNAEKWTGQLLQKKFISADEQIREKYRPAYEKIFVIHENFFDPVKLKELAATMTRARSQASFLLGLAALLEHTGKNEISSHEIKEIAGFSQSACRSIIQKGILKTVEKEIIARKSHQKNLSALKSLTLAQGAALNEIKEGFSKQRVVLLHGITSSGKTEIYFHLILEEIKKGKEVLYLLPEIALTAQIVNRLRQVFGNLVRVYHSRYSDRERIETYYRLVRPSEKGSVSIILGARSAIFLPFEKLGLVIVDEEHENTYKQSDPAPRYHARDAAIILAGIHQAKVLLGTATPSFETYYNTQVSKYSLVELNERYGNIELPEVRVVNLRELYRKKIMKSHFSPLLLDEIRKSLSRKQQIILFQNRRGFSNYLECMSCGWIPVCRACDVSLTYHKESNRLICHYCGHSSPIPHSCGECQGTEIRTRGFGTEKVAEEFSIFFPESRLIRFDLDAAKSRKQYESIIRDFEEGKTDVLVGTQIISKGLDFENVGLVGILNADNLLKFPDFRAYERSYQLMAQVAGRAGRKKKKGLVVIQTSDPGNEVINNVMNNDYKNIYSQQIAERKKFNYPPFSRLLRISIRHRNKGMLETASSLIASDLKNIQGILVLGPQAPLISRIKGSYIKDILIKIPRSPKLAVYKETIRNLLEEYTGHTTYRGLQVIVDVDP